MQTSKRIICMLATWLVQDRVQHGGRGWLRGGGQQFLHRRDPSIIARLPARMDNDDMIRSILAFVPPCNVVNQCRSVCRRWRVICDEIRNRQMASSCSRPLLIEEKDWCPRSEDGRDGMEGIAYRCEYRTSVHENGRNILRNAKDVEESARLCHLGSTILSGEVQSAVVDHTTFSTLASWTFNPTELVREIPDDRDCRILGTGDARNCRYVTLRSTEGPRDPADAFEMEHLDCALDYMLLHSHHTSDWQTELLRWAKWRLSIFISSGNTGCYHPFSQDVTRMFNEGRHIRCRYLRFRIDLPLDWAQGM